MIACREKQEHYFFTLVVVKLSAPDFGGEYLLLEVPNTEVELL